MKQLETVSVGQLLRFFVPLGLAACLVTISHLIINGTLARSDQPETIIAAFAVAMSLLVITERPAVLLRQTCSALVRDNLSFRAMTRVTLIVLGAVFLFGLAIGYSPIGFWLFTYLFGATDQTLQMILNAYRVLMFVSLFSAIRCLYQGILISHMHTKWLTIGMVIRLLVMGGISMIMLQQGWVNSALAGAIIFLSGMVTEATVSYWKGRSLLHEMPEVSEKSKAKSSADIYRFYRPMLVSSLIAVIGGPAIAAMLGRTVQWDLAIASFTIASSVAHLVISVFTYVHQIVINFYESHEREVFRFVFVLSLLPGTAMAILGFTPIGTLMLAYVMGVEGALLDESINALRVLGIMAIVFPWLDYYNGRIMLSGHTGVMVWSQSAHVLILLLTLMVLITWQPGWNGMIGAYAVSFGMAAELFILFWAVRNGGELRWPYRA